MLDYYINEAQNPWEIYRNLDKVLMRHCENVAALAALLYGFALEEGLYPGQMSKEQLAQIGNAVIYHDIGKSRIPIRILNKKGPLNALERRLIMGHVSHGLDIFAPLMESRHDSRDTELFLDAAIQSISHHHEWFDGSGYPGGLKGEEISVIGRICCLCNYYDVLTSDRPHHRALSHREVAGMIQVESGRMFDPALVELFTKNSDAFRQIKVLSEAKESYTGRHKKMPQTETCIRCEHLPKVVTRDMCIDITGLGAKPAAEPQCIRLRKHKNLIVKSKPGIEHENLSFHLEGGNLLLLEDVYLKSETLPLITVEGDNCLIVFTGDCRMESSMESFAIQILSYSKGLRISTPDHCQSRLAIGGISSSDCEGRPLPPMQISTFFSRFLLQNEYDIFGDCCLISDKRQFFMYSHAGIRFPRRFLEKLLNIVVQRSTFAAN